MAERTKSSDNDDAPARAAPAPVLKIAFAAGVAVYLALVGAQVTAPTLTGLISGSGARAADVADEGDEQAAERRALQPPIYLPLDPPLVVSFTDGAGRTRFMQLSLQAMAREQKAIDAVKTHSPALRNAFLFLISKRSVDELSTVEGKEKLRADMLTEAQSIMRENTGSVALEELYFTSLVIQ